MKAKWCFLVLRKALLGSYCVVVWVMFLVFCFFCFTLLVDRNTKSMLTKDTK